MNETGHWTGAIVLERVGGRWTGKMLGDQGSTSVELHNVRLTAQELQFDVPSSTQVYRGRLLPGGRIVGQFTWSGRSWDWTATETPVR